MQDARNEIVEKVEEVGAKVGTEVLVHEKGTKAVEEVKRYPNAVRVGVELEVDPGAGRIELYTSIRHHVDFSFCCTAIDNYYGNEKLKVI